MNVYITELEMLTISMVSNLRGIGSRIAGVADGKISDKNGSEIEFEGMLGEFAFCKHYNIFFDFTPSPRSGSYDCMLNNKRIDIKATKYKTGVLIGKQPRNNDIDIYVLAILDFKKNGVNVYFPGYATSDELYDEKNLTFLKETDSTPVYAISQNNLHKFK